ncbi:hypothetical protein ACJX0J_020102, partial [Zea mays]
WNYSQLICWHGIIPHLIDGGLSILQYADDTVIVSPSTHNSLWRCPTHFHDVFLRNPDWCG